MAAESGHRQGLGGMSDAILDPVGHPEVLFVCPQNALEEFFGTDRVPLTVTSTVTGTTLTSPDSGT